MFLLFAGAEKVSYVLEVVLSFLKRFGNQLVKEPKYIVLRF